MTDPIEDAARAAIAGKLVVFPTDTVYGIGTRPDDPAATARLFEAKGRPRELELPVLVPTAAAAREIAAFDARAEALTARHWPGPVTVVLPRTARSAPWELGGDPTTIGVRVPHYPLALALLARTGPLAATSANRSGAPTPGTCDGLERAFGDRVSVYVCLDEPLRGKASTVVDLAHEELALLRRGSISEASIRAAIRGATAREPKR